VSNCRIIPREEIKGGGNSNCVIYVTEAISSEKTVGDKGAKTFKKMMGKKIGR